MPSYDYECSKGHEYEAVLSIKNYRSKTRCPKCNQVGKKVIKHRQKEPSFTDKLYSNGFWDKALNKIFHSPQERNAYLQRKGYVVKDDGHMTPKQERIMYNMRIGRFDPRDARHVLKD